MQYLYRMKSQVSTTDRKYKVPTVLVNPPYNYDCLELEGFEVIKTCTHISEQKGSLFLQDHMLLVVLQGTYTVRYSKQEYTLRSNQMVVLRKSIAREYDKSGDPENDHMCEYIMFFIKDELLKEFAQMTNMEVKASDEMSPVSIKDVNAQFRAFVASIQPYLQNGEGVDKGLAKLKMLELLYGLASTDKNLMRQMLQLIRHARTNINQVMENNYLNPVSVEGLAYLSGRSLSAFKRDFQAIYNTSPSKWIREKRLSKAKDLLNTTSMSVRDICYAIGFENPAHFSRIFKEYYGFSPTYLRQTH